MRGVDLQASLSNLTQIDRLQQEGHRTPMVHQEANATKAREEAARRMEMPVQPDQVDGKKIDPEGKREEKRQLKKRRRQEEEQGRRRSRGDTGRFVDIDA